MYHDRFHYFIIITGISSAKVTPTEAYLRGSHSSLVDRNIQFYASHSNDTGVAVSQDAVLHGSDLALSLELHVGCRILFEGLSRAVNATSLNMFASNQRNIISVKALYFIDYFTVANRKKGSE